MKTDADGSRSLGLSTKVLPQAIAMRKHPARHHAGEVERRDAGHDAERLAQRPVVDARGDLVGEVALEQLRNAAGEFDDLDAARDLALRIAEHLAVLAGDESRPARRGARSAARGTRPARARGAPAGSATSPASAALALATAASTSARWRARPRVRSRPWPDRTPAGRAPGAGDGSASDPVRDQFGAAGLWGCGAVLRRELGDCHGSGPEGLL